MAVGGQELGKDKYHIEGEKKGTNPNNFWAQHFDIIPTI